ncbi:MAG: hypothetical protein OSA04_04880 [Flavobacteriales bacterium]|nr:hypothetical protein [Flavobacteriales bacterium]
MKSIQILTTFLLFVSLTLFSCVRTPGEGGRASITGSVELIRRVQLNNPQSNVDTIAASNVEVFIIYGDHLGPDDKVDTNPDGDFTFEWLRTGDYTLYVYSEDTSVTSTPLPRVPVSFEIEIQDKDDVIQLDPFVIYDDY